MMLQVAKEPAREPEEPVRLRRPRRGRDEEDIDITPMIDLVFLLLIFFLVSSIPDQQTAIDLPSATHGTSVSQVHSVVFTIADVGNVYAADGRVAGKELPDDAEARSARVQQLVRDGVRDDKTDVVIKADKNVAHRKVAELIKAVSQVTGIKIHLAVMDEK
jgi:biopolymer transport protein ExbD